MPKLLVHRGQPTAESLLLGIFQRIERPWTQYDRPALSTISVHLNVTSLNPSPGIYLTICAIVNTHTFLSSVVTAGPYKIHNHSPKWYCIGPMSYPIPPCAPERLDRSDSPETELQTRALIELQSVFFNLPYGDTLPHIPSNPCHVFPFHIWSLRFIGISNPIQCEPSRFHFGSMFRRRREHWGMRSIITLATHTSHSNLHSP